MFYKYQNNKGYSFVEILITIAVLAVISSAITASFFSFYKTRALGKEAARVLDLIHEARSKTVSSKDASEYGMHFDASRAVLFKGIVFTEPSSDNKEITLLNSVEIFDISLNQGAGDLFFKRITGETDNFGIIRFRLKGNSDKIKTIVISGGGIAELK